MREILFVLTVLADFLSVILTSIWFWISLFLILIGILLTRFYRTLKLQTLEKVKYGRTFSTDGIFVNESLQLIETIENPTWFPLFGVQVNFFIPSGLTIDDLTCSEYKKVISIFYIPPYSTVEKKHLVTANKRSHYQLNTACIIYRKNEILFSDALDFYAYPNYHRANIALTPDLYHAGNAISNRKYIEDPFFLSGIRPYHLGDPMRSINFKASVRSFSGGARQWLCNNYDSTRNYDSMIYLDLTTYTDISMKSEDQLELGLQYACFLFCEAIKNDGRVGFSTNSTNNRTKYTYIPCGSGDFHSKNILKTFSKLNWYDRHDYSMAALLMQTISQLSIGTDIYLITPFIDSELSKSISAIQKAGFNICVIPLLQGGISEKNLSS